MAQETRTVLVTGCSEGSLGEALALAFREKGLKVFATVRDPAKATNLQNAGAHILTVDVLQDSSIKSCVEEISSITNGTLDILVNNAGGGHYMPFLHLDLDKAKQLFEVNVWSYLAVAQAFMPLLMKGKSIGGKHSLLVNNTSISSVSKPPFHSAYAASKAAMAMFNDIQRVELRPFGIEVIDLKTGSTESNFADNRTNELVLPEDSPYKPIEEEVLGMVTGAKTEAYAEEQKGWAKDVVEDLLKDNPPTQVWRGGMAGTVKISNAADNILPTSVSDIGFRQLGGLNKLEKMLRERGAN